EEHDVSAAGEGLVECLLVEGQVEFERVGIGGNGEGNRPEQGGGESRRGGGTLGGGRYQKGISGVRGEKSKAAAPKCKPCVLARNGSHPKEESCPDVQMLKACHFAIWILRTDWGNAYSFPSSRCNARTRSASSSALTPSTSISRNADSTGSSVPANRLACT